MAKKRLKSRNKKQSRVMDRKPADRIFLLHIKKSLYVIIIWALSIIIHNLIYRFFSMDEEILSTFAVYIMPAYLLVSIIYTLSRHKKFDEK